MWLKLLKSHQSSCVWSWKTWWCLSTIITILLWSWSVSYSSFERVFNHTCNKLLPTFSNRFTHSCFHSLLGHNGTVPVYRKNWNFEQRGRVVISPSASSWASASLVFCIVSWLWLFIVRQIDCENAVLFGVHLTSRLWHITYSIQLDVGTCSQVSLQSFVRSMLSICYASQKLLANVIY